MSGDYDIVIVGGGLSGGSLALALRGSGYRIAVVEAFSDEQRRSSPAGDRALALSYGTVCHFMSLGLWDGLEPQSAPIVNIHVSDRGHFGKTRLSARTEGVDALGYVIGARVLEDKIASALEVSDIERICPAGLMGIKSGPDSIPLTLRKESSEFTLSTRLLVGADGMDSSVRRFLNIGQETRDYRQTAIVTQVRPDIDPAGTAFERFTATGPLAMLPVLNGCCSVVWTQPSAAAQQIMALDDEEFLARLQSAFGFRLGRLTLESKRVQFPLKLVRAKAMIGQRSVLVGNTVHQLHPVAGQGFNLGMRDIALLAEMIRDDLGKGRDPGGNALLKAYAAARSTDHETLIRFTDGVVRLFSNDWLPLAGARGLGLLGLDRCDWAKHLLTRHAMGLGGRLPRIGIGLDR
ncbi:MAG: 2-octaprenyl-6-methoxyphenyl hydroxylase [Methylococcales bacterium]